MEKGHYSVLRVSHLSQIDNFSIEQQKESIETYARIWKHARKMEPVVGKTRM